MKLTVLGAGCWGLTLAWLLTDNFDKVTVWGRAQDLSEDLISNKHTSKPLEVQLKDKVEITSDMVGAIDGADIILSVVATSGTRDVCENLKKCGIKPEQIFVNASKGIEESSLMVLTDVILDEIPKAKVAVISGPSHAEEVSRLIPTTVVVAAQSRATAEFLQDTFMTERFRVYTSNDIIGVELGGSLKNVIALAAGMSDGLGFGDNTKAALMTRGLAEINRLGIAMGAKPETLSGLSGIGDLFVTCTSHHSRNWNAGNLIGQGKTVEEALKEVNQVVEGVYCAKAALKLARKFYVEMPIVEQVNAILFDKKPVAEAVNELFMRERRAENNAISW
mgnify:CR=1 FL=1